MKVLVPLDLVQPVEPIIASVATLINLQNAAVTLLFVRETLPAYESVAKTAGEFPDDWDQQVDKKARTQLQDAAVLMKKHCPNVSTELTHGSPAMMIETVARDGKFDATVTTPRHHSMAERMFLGSVSGKVIKHAKGTVVIVRQLAKLQHVMVGLDGSANSRHALRTAIKQFHIDKTTKFTLVHSVDLPDAVKFLTPVEFVSQVEQNLLMEGETFLADGKRILHEAGFDNVELLLKEKDPGGQLLKLSKELAADLLVLGAQGHTAVQHFLLGSVSHRVATHARCSVAVIKPEAN